MSQISPSRFDFSSTNLLAKVVSKLSIVFNRLFEMAARAKRLPLPALKNRGSCGSVCDFENADATARYDFWVLDISIQSHSDEPILVDSIIMKPNSQHAAISDVGYKIQSKGFPQADQ